MSGCEDEDFIIISDLDEIPNPKKIFENKDKDGIVFFKQKMYYYFLNNINIRNPYWFDLCSKMLRYKDIKRFGLTPQKIRFLKPSFLNGRIINSGGWHFSYIGGACSVIKKIRSFSHQEFNNEEYTKAETIKKKILMGRHLFDDGDRRVFSGLKLDSSFPEYIFKNSKKYEFLLADGNINFYFRLILLLNMLKSNIIIFFKKIKNTIKYEI